MKLKFSKIKYCAESDSAQYHTAQSHVFREYLRENEFFSETILDCLSGTQMGWINEKKNAKKSRDTASLNCQVISNYSHLNRLIKTKQLLNMSYVAIEGLDASKTTIFL